MHDENCIRRFALRIFLRIPDGPIMETQLRQRLTRRKFEIADRVIALDRRWILGGEREARGEDQQERWKNGAGWNHVSGIAVQLGFV